MYLKLKQQKPIQVFVVSILNAVVTNGLKVVEKKIADCRFLL